MEARGARDAFFVGTKKKSTSNDNVMLVGSVKTTGGHVEAIKMLTSTMIRHYTGVLRANEKLTRAMHRNLITELIRGESKALFIYFLYG